jgi:hypothetical protein
MTPAGFVRKWLGSTQTERAAAQEHTSSTCAGWLVSPPRTRTQPGPTTPSRRASRRLAGGGFADIWKRGHFAWEYKVKHRNLGAAYQQLLQYREALENPPLLVVCDLDRFRQLRDPAIRAALRGARQLVDPLRFTSGHRDPAAPLAGLLDPT